MRRLVAFLLLTMVAAASPAAEAPPTFEQRPVAGAVDHFGVVYLPDRVAGDDWRNRWVTVNVHVPQGMDRPLPCIVFVHGGGYGAGDKDGRLGGAGGPPYVLLEQAVREGFVAVNLNYILNIERGGGIHPQVWLDFKNAIRFLRANATTYRIDPCRIAAWGFSAGGWLAGSGAFTTADDYHETPRTDAATDWYGRRQRGKVLLLPLDDLHTPYEDYTSRLTAVVADFWPKKHYDLYSADDPAILTYVGQGAEHALVKRAEAVGNEGVNLVLTDAKFKGKPSLHVPPVDAACAGLDGSGTSTLKDEAFAWLKRRLVVSPRMVPPEARPNQRVFAERTEVRLVAAAPDVRIRYTLDGSDPTQDSPLYTQPFTVTRTTTVKAFAECEGFPPSAVAAFTFTRGTPAPTLVGPERLPTASVGRPWSVAFHTAEEGEFLWNIGGHAVPEVKMHTRGYARPPLGIVLDPKTGVLSGTPTRAGAYTVAIEVARGLRQPADVRAYALEIRE
jgi:acetyl esterase/lipase